jgi:nucleotide-binding universal stress UspA family protein
MIKTMKILIGYDGSASSDAAIEDLRWAGLPPEAEAVVLTVADVWDVNLPEGDLEAANADPEILSKVREETKQALEAARTMSERASERVQALFPGWQVRAERRADSPAWGLVKKADAWKPHLIVTGSHGRSAVGRIFLGSVSQTVVTHARCSVRIARGRPDRGDAPVRLVVGVDGSPVAEAAISAVAQRDWPPGSEARVIAVIYPLMVPVSVWATEAYEDEDDWARGMVNAAAEKLRDSGLIATPLVRGGTPSHVLIEEAEDWKADSIFVGATGLRGVERLLLGSVSTAVATRAHCSVEVVRLEQPS